MRKLLAILLFILPLQAKDIPPATLTAAAAEKFLATLDPPQKAKANLPFAGEERENFHFTPLERAGLPLKEMTDAQRGELTQLLRTALSERGVNTIQAIMSLESILADIEKNPEYRDSGKYYLTIFGTPGDSKGWGWRFEGHHLSINLTFVDGKCISVTPSFLGSNPAEVREGPHKGLRALAAEENLARTLVASLLATGKSTVIFSEKPPGDVITGEKRTVTALDPVGLTASEMTETQRSALLTLISQYTGRYRPEIAAADMEKIKTAGIDKIRFGWAGGTKLGEAYYYRIQGPTFLMEAANVQNHANHLHTTWRDFTGDFGRDLLREHLDKEH